MSKSTESHASPNTAASHAPLWVDLRLPFAVCVVEALLLLVLAILLAPKIVEYPSVGVGILVAYLISAGAILITYSMRYSRMRKAEVAAEQVGTDIYRLFRTSVDIPYAVVNGDGTIRVVNTALQTILGARGPVCNIPLCEVCPHISMEHIVTHARMRGVSDTAIPPSAQQVEAGVPTVRLGNGRRYRVESYLLRRDRDPFYFLIFRDANDYLELLDRTNRTHIVMAYIVLDNLQELTQFVRANYRETVNRIEQTLASWVEGMQGVLREYDRDKYLAVFTSEMLDRCIQDKFSILDTIMGIHVGDNSFPVSISMGIADIDGTMLERERAANTALEMALQRGGNQVALQRRGASGLTYFGGAHKTLENNTAISSRVSAHLIKQKLLTSDHVLVMGHANPDFDSIGSSVGAYRLCRSMLENQERAHIPVHIVTDMACDTFRICRKYLDAVPEYNEVFMDKTVAQQSITSRTMLVITDVSNPVIFEAPQLISCIPSVDGVSSIAVIDHHRLVSELPFTPFLHYIEATKSSASEIIAEIFQQSDLAETLPKEEANLLLAGIMLDTHNFTRAAGARTFDVVSYLYSRSAHTDVAREFFNESIEEIKVAGDFDAHTVLYQNIFAIARLSPDHVPSPDDRIAASKAADKLLNIRGVEASFAFAIVGNSVSISARSKGRVNVQLIMEKLDGGGHFDMAGAQVIGGVHEAYNLLTSAIDEYLMQEQSHPKE